MSDTRIGEVVCYATGNMLGRHHVFRTYVGGSEPWRECDAEGWIAVGGQIPADIETQVRSVDGQVRDGCKPVDREDNSALWGPELTHWRSAAGMEASPELTRENAKCGVSASEWVTYPNLIHAPPERMAWIEINYLGTTRQCQSTGSELYKSYMKAGCQNPIRWRYIDGPASAPKAEEPAKEEAPDENHAMKWRDEWAPDESLRVESDRERAHREEQERMRDHEKRCAESRELIRTWGTADNPHFAPAGLLLVAPIWSPR